MIAAQKTKSVVLVGPVTASTAATASARVDTLGFRYLVIDAILGKASATNASAKWQVLKLTEADLTTVSSGVAIVAFTGTTNTVTDATNGFVIAAQNDTSVGQVGKFKVDLRGRKRYLFVTYEAHDATTNIVAIKAELSRAEEMPNTMAEAGLGFMAQG